MEKDNINFPKKARPALDQFTQEAQEILKEELEPESSHDYTPIMFHYTNDIGLKGIINSGNLWLTDMFSLNDPSELQYGYSVAADILAAKAKGDTFAEHFAAQFGINLKNAFQDQIHFFCCSFSKVGNNLGQWRAYANDGNGFAIGFDCAKLQPKFISGPSSAAFPMNYDGKLLHKTHTKLIEKFFPHLSGHNSLNPQCPEEVQKYGSLYKALMIPALRASLHFKHLAYWDEREYRFMKIQNIDDSSKIKSRSRNYQLIKYMEFDWKSAGPDVLKKIVIGPAADFEKSKRFAEDCLCEAGIDVASVEIRQSDIPYKPA